MPRSGVAGIATSELAVFTSLKDHDLTALDFISRRNVIDCMTRMRMLEKDAAKALPSALSVSFHGYKHFPHQPDATEAVDMIGLGRPPDSDPPAGVHGGNCPQTW